MAVRPDNKTVTVATDIDFLVSRFWFKLNKQLVPNHIPVSLDIVARSQAVLTREVSRKVKILYEELRQKDLSDAEQQSLYANLTEAERYLAPYNSSFTEDVLTFIEYKGIDEMIKDQRNLRQKAAEAEKAQKELSEMKSQLAQREEQIEGMEKDIAEKEKGYQKTHEDAAAKEIRQRRWIIGLIVAVVVLAIAFVLSLVL